MSPAEAAPAAPRLPLPAADGIGDRVLFDPSRPLYVTHLAPPAERLTLAVVSIRRLRALTPAQLDGMTGRHFTASEDAYARSLPAPRRRYDWLAGRLALKHAVAAHQRRYRGIALEPPEVGVRTVTRGIQAGKPVVDAPLEVGLSHAGDFAVAVCGPHAIGVDLEYDRRIPPLLAQLLAADHDPAAVSPDARRLRAMPLALRWACKEAVLKHYGFGLRVDAREVALTGWRPDGGFTWRPGGGLLRHAPAADTRPPAGWARRLQGHFLALVWT
ncbi:4'-phosphopantetheinyl transferase family protein [Streptomyces naganishii]|uniref:4'-phosphopantetheinyl transferase domain-containing protein n=1 Tax=Streptomyces naganishii JCM 4654 TaxID=1306179 RepID=A0A918Y319_9ACTN|nr:4'-phosphopantetheinyl transferase superfamily protein [Streptomyces naganishii]GHD88853.1 hypothetical protein GCM10010508_26590 [Streptomyces naganishii JCM 4654]